MTHLQPIIASTLVQRFTEGGTFFMSLILVLLLLSVFHTVKGITTLKTNTPVSIKMLSRINDSGILALSLGFLSAFVGLIGAFDVLEASGEAGPDIIAGGLKVALLSPLFGLLTYSVSKFSVLVLRMLQK